MKPVEQTYAWPQKLLPFLGVVFLQTFDIPDFGHSRSVIFCSFCLDSFTVFLEIFVNHLEYYVSFVKILNLYKHLLTEWICYDQLFFVLYCIKFKKKDNSFNILCFQNTETHYILLLRQPFLTLLICNGRCSEHKVNQTCFDYCCRAS